MATALVFERGDASADGWATKACVDRVDISLQVSNSVSVVRGTGVDTGDEAGSVDSSERALGERHT